MLKNFLTVAWRNLRRHRLHSGLNIAGLAVGMGVALLIGLWVADELSFDHYDPHYRRVAEVMQNRTFDGTIQTGKAIPVPLGEELRKSYGSDFKYVAMSTWCWGHTMSAGEKHLFVSGCFMQPDGPEVLGLTIVEGAKEGLRDASSIIVSRSLARSLFGDRSALNKTVRLDDQDNFTITGVYEDFPRNSTFYQKECVFVAPWEYYAAHSLSKENLTDWGDNSWLLFVQLADNTDMTAVSGKIRDVKLNNVSTDDKRAHPQLFLYPMDKWHLYSQFKDGQIDGGRIEYVWLFGIIGVFVLLLACINFMNLSTASSERRAKEVGIRKTMGSLRRQLVGQFYCESLLFAGLAFGCALLLAKLAMPFFNMLSGKAIDLPWDQSVFWLAGVGFAVLTGFIAGSYPALYLSAFRPVKVLKGVARAGRNAAIPRQVLVVLQFTVGVLLMIGTAVVFRQIQYAKDRPVGYNREGLVNVEMATDTINRHFDAMRTDLLTSGVVTAAAESTSPATAVSWNTGAVNWPGKDPNVMADFANIHITDGYGKTVGWQFVSGRDFRPHFATDSLAVVLNETAVRYMDLKEPVGQIIEFGGQPFRIIGVIRDMLMESPYEPVKPTIFHLSKNAYDYLYLRVNPGVGAHTAIEQIGKIFKVYAPDVPFEYRWVDQAFAEKFANEERTGNLAGVFAVLAIFISCLGLFGMASFLAEQRIKEIGIRKVLGATVLNLWGMLSRDFLALVAVALLIAVPSGWYLMNRWLQHYAYRTEIAWWIFAAAGAGAILITMLTVSYQSIKAALRNPVSALRSE